MDTASIHRSVVVVDVEGYGDVVRTTHDRLAVRGGMYAVMRSAFEAVGLPWDDRTVDDAGDSLLFVLPAEVPKLRLVDALPERVAAGLRRYNAVHASGARLRMRMAVHAGEVHHDGHGKTGPALIFACRILDARDAKRALADSTATLVLIVSDAVHASVVSQDPAARPAEFRRIGVQVKETRAHAWIRLVDGGAGPAAPARGDRGPDLVRPLVDVLLGTPGFDSREGRDLVLRDVPFGPAVPRMPTARADVVSIVRTGLGYPDGLAALLDAVRFYAEGSVPMAELDELLAAWRAGGR
ncbi:hypothetical protein AB0I60_07590 [Actinosynnema sp. NPDC050436]|uniref:effector-associated domain 2-containing protein n=1 Tax=Actinosynnema sp. NPDC050436 TaxID=3155659 RepID=UPI0033C50E5B